MHQKNAPARDFRKAFDSVDWPTAIRLLRRAGLPNEIAAPLGTMWQKQRRWIGFGGSTYVEPIRGVLALPQGDPFSPVALALVLAGPAFKIARSLPTAISTVYLDDRTALFSSFGQLKEYIREWSVFGEFRPFADARGQVPILGSDPVRLVDSVACRASP